MAFFLVCPLCQGKPFFVIIVTLRRTIGFFESTNVLSSIPRFGHKPGAVAVESSQLANKLTCCNAVQGVQGSLVLHCVFCYSAQELKPTSNLNRQVPILIAAAVIALVCLVQALPLFSPRFDLVPRLEWITYDMRMRLAANRSELYATNLLAGVFITDQDLKDMSDGTYG